MHRMKKTRDKVSAASQPPAPPSPSSSMSPPPRPPSPILTTLRARDRTSALSALFASKAWRSAAAASSPAESMSSRAVSARSSRGAWSSPCRRWQQSEAGASRTQTPAIVAATKSQMTTRKAETTTTLQPVTTTTTERTVRTRQRTPLSPSLPLALAALTLLIKHSRFRSQSEDAWRRENALVREQLKAATRREIALQRRAPVAPEAGAQARATRAVVSARERELLGFIIEVVGKDTVRSLLSANPHASPAELRQKLRHFHHQQQQRLSPRHSSPTPVPSPSAAWKAHDRSPNSLPRDASATASRAAVVKPSNRQRQQQQSPTNALDAVYAKCVGACALGI
ncbi:hypothetical protein PybrP1_000595, partial [[Pythium] brassicae (nom. inval.)]